MANAQDILTRSRWQKADLEALLRQELEQVFGEDLERARLAGPPAELAETTTHALGLIFHELATNSMKYGSMSSPRGEISIRWSIDEEKPGSGRMLRIEWSETSSETVVPPEETGFGTRLIDASVKIEAGGAIEREYKPQGLAVRLFIPMTG